MRASIGLALGCLMGLAPASGFAQEMIDARNPDKVAEILKGFGIARVGETSDGDPKISGRADGKTYEVFFFDCTENKDCRNIQFWAYWDEAAPLEALNAWNRQTRFGRVYLDEDDDVVLELGVNMSKGMDERTLEDNADIWVRMMQGVSEDIFGN